MQEEQITAAIHATIAKTILEALDTEARDALLQKSIAEVLGGYKFRAAIDEVVAAKAKRVAEQLVASDEWTRAIEATMRESFAQYIQNLRVAAEKMLVDVFHGTDGTYSHASLALRCWPKPKPEA